MKAKGKHKLHNNPITGKKLTVKQYLFIKEFLNNGFVGNRAIKAVYNTKNTRNADNLYRSNSNNPIVIETLRQALGINNLNEEYIATKLKKVIDAGTTKEALERTTPDHAIKALKITSDLYKDRGNNNKDTTNNNLTIKYNINSREDLEKIINEQNQALLKYQSVIKSKLDPVEEVKEVV